jgi:hypothetical protein
MDAALSAPSSEAQPGDPGARLKWFTLISGSVLAAIAVLWFVSSSQIRDDRTGSRNATSGADGGIGREPIRGFERLRTQLANVFACLDYNPQAGYEVSATIDSSGHAMSDRDFYLPVQMLCDR